MKIFWASFAVDSVIFAVLFYFFLAGLGDGTVGSFNIALWVAIIAVPAAVLLGGWWLKSNGHRGWATGVVTLMAVPGLLLGCFFLLMMAAFSGSHH